MVRVSNVEERQCVMAGVFCDRDASGEHQLSAARTEQLRARGAASEFLGSRAQEGELKLPGGGKLGSGGVKEQPQGVIVSL